MALTRLIERQLIYSVLVQVTFHVLSELLTVSSAVGVRLTTEPFGIFALKVTPIERVAVRFTFCLQIAASESRANAGDHAAFAC